MSLYLGTTPIADGASTALLAEKADVGLTNLNSSGTSLASGWSMPSSRYIDLTLGASGATYTAPANGWFNVGWNGIGANLTGRVKNLTANIYLELITTSYDYSKFVLVPVRKGDSINVIFSSAYNIFRFIYAEGEQ